MRTVFRFCCGVRSAGCLGFVFGSKAVARHTPRRQVRLRRQHEVRVRGAGPGSKQRPCNWIYKKKTREASKLETLVFCIHAENESADPIVSWASPVAFRPFLGLSCPGASPVELHWGGPTVRIFLAVPSASFKTRRGPVCSKRTPRPRSHATSMGNCSALTRVRVPDVIRHTYPRTRNLISSLD